MLIPIGEKIVGLAREKALEGEGRGFVRVPERRDVDLGEVRRKWVGTGGEWKRARIGPTSC